MSPSDRQRGRRGRTSYSRYFHGQVRTVLLRHIRKRERGFRTIARLLMEFEPSGTVADEAYDVLSREAIRDFCQKGRFLPDPLIDLICDYLRQEEPHLSGTFEEAEFREAVGESFMLFLSIPDRWDKRLDLVRGDLALHNIFLNLPGYDPKARTMETQIRRPDAEFLHVLAIRRMEGQRVDLAAKIAVENPAKRDEDRRSGWRPIPQVGFSVPTIRGNVLMLRRQLDRTPVLEVCADEPYTGIFVTNILGASGPFEMMDDVSSAKWVRVDDDLSIYSQLVSQVDDRIQRMAWR